MTRLRQAKEEAEREVQQYRTNMEAEYQNKLSEVRTKCSLNYQYHKKFILVKKRYITK